MTDPRTVRQWFESAFAPALGPSDGSQDRRKVGELELADFQQRAASRGLDIVRTYGGVVLADAVGLGKTRVSLSIASALCRDARLRRAPTSHLWCCVPARLRQQWEQAATKARVGDFDVVTHTQLSRGDFCATPPPAAVVVDEAHRFRNPRAQRSAALAEIAAQSPVVLATATPVCNGLDDLYHLLRIFLAEQDLRAAVGYNLCEAFSSARAGQFDLTELVEQVVIRRIEAPTSCGFGRRPGVDLEVVRYEAAPAERWLWQNLADELRRMNHELFRRDWPEALLVEYVLRRWESGADALRETLAQMIAFHRRWLEAGRHGRTLSRARFRQLFDDAASRHQGVFPFVFEVVSSVERSSKNSRQARVEHDLEVLEGINERVGRLLEQGHGAWRVIAELAETDGQKLLVFTSYQHAARGLCDFLVDRLGSRARIGCVTGEGAWATGLGRVGPQEVLRRFAPRAYGFAGLADHHQLDVLIGTDCLSEGVNLQDCGRVVLADLPYSPLGIEQRVGRLVRPGGPHRRVRVYLPRPQAWQDSLGMRRRIDEKLSQAAASGAAFSSTPQLDDADATASAPEPDALSASPLAALTRLDALADSFVGEDTPPMAEGFWARKSGRAPRRLWLRVAVREARGGRFLWCLSCRRRGVLIRLHELLAQLADDIHRAGAIEPVDRLPEELFGPACAVLEQRERALRAARLAPFPLRLDAPQRGVWRQLLRDAQSGAIEVSEEELGKVRERLLRAYPRGAERRLEQLNTAELPPARVLGRVREITASAPQWSPEVRFEVVSGLLI